MSELSEARREINRLKQIAMGKGKGKGKEKRALRKAKRSFMQKFNPFKGEYRA